MSIWQVLADAVLAAHVGVVVFVVGGLVLIGVGNALRWSWVNALWFRLAHLAAIGVVVTEAWFGIVCPLTTLEMFLRSKVPGAATYGGSFVEHWLQRVLYVEAPEWVFTMAYSTFGLLVVAAWWFFPPGHRQQSAPPEGREQTGRRRSPLQAIVSTVPPSTRNAAPVVADACSEHT